MNFAIITLLFIGSIIVHEFGHWLYLRFYGIKAPVIIKWYAIIVAPEGEGMLLSVKKSIWFFLIGPLVGLPFVIFLPPVFIIAYFVMCVVDIGNAINILMMLNRNNANESLLSAMQKDLEKTKMVLKKKNMIKTII